MRSTTKRCLLGVFLSGALLVCFLVLLFDPSAYLTKFGNTLPAFTRDKSEQITVGMTQSEVEEILAAPPGDYTTADWVGGPLDAWSSGSLAWISDKGYIAVRFDDSRVVRVAFFSIVLLPKKHLLNRVWDWTRRAGQEKGSGPE